MGSANKLTTSTVTPEAMAAYRATAQRRAAADEAERIARRERALKVAHKAAAHLRDRFGATVVWVFGSLADETFTLWSDVDIAARGIAMEEYFVAVAHMQDLSPEFSVDLIDLDRCKPGLREHVERTGVQL